ncbi:MAG: hypothetical protein RI940_1263, partial [Bacteroidota bacterium]
MYSFGRLNVIMRKYFILFFLLVINISLNAQGTIKGNIVNNGKALEFVTVTISNVKDSTKVLFYEASDSAGMFHFTNLEYGNYLIKMKLVGYVPIIKNVRLNPEQNEVYLKDLNLLEDNTDLNKVTVVAQKKMIEKT